MYVNNEILCVGFEILSVNMYFRIHNYVWNSVIMLVFKRTEGCLNYNYR